MARPGKRNAPKQTPENAAATQGLRDAVAFVRQAQKDDGSIHQTHMMMANKWLWTFDGILAAAHPVPDENVACPHGALFLDALKRVGAGLTITQTDAASLMIASQKFRAVVPCVTFADMPNVAPDRMIAPCDDRLRTSLGIAGRFSKESAPRIIEASLLLTSGVVTGTNGNVIIQSRHDIDMPELVLPKSTATVLAKQTKKLKGFGFSASTVTFWFEDDAWIRSQLYVESWPPLDSIWRDFDMDKMTKLPADFFEGIASIASFNEASRAFIDDGVISSHHADDRDKVGATYTVKGLVGAVCLNPDNVLPLKDVVTEAAFGQGMGVYFMGKDCRAAVARCVDYGKDRGYVAATPPPPGPTHPVGGPVDDAGATARRRAAEAAMLAQAAGIKPGAKPGAYPIDDDPDKDIPF